MALRMNLFRTPNHRKYDYIPRYYNPDKEALEERLKRAEVMADDSIEGMKNRISSNLKRGGNSKDYEFHRRKALMKSNLLLLAIIIILLFATGIILEVYLPDIIKKFE